MSITDKTRKILWGRSGNLCAICRHDLVMDATQADDESVIGEECHIVGKEIDGPRGNSPLDPNRRDEYDNLLLLCRIHHKLIDDQPNTYTVNVLRNIKISHENWVRSTLRLKKTSPAQPPMIAFRIRSGQQFFNTLIGSHAFSFNNDRPEDEGEMHLLGDFAQNIEDYIDLWDTLESKQRLVAQFEMDKNLDQLYLKEFLVFGCQQNRKRKFIDKIENWRIAYIVVLRMTNHLVKKKSEDLEQVSLDVQSHQDDFTNFIFIKAD